MEAFRLRAEIRSPRGKGGAGRLRRQGYVPAVVYGQEAHLPVAVEAREVQRLLQKSGSSPLVKVVIQGPNGEREYTTVVRDIQHSPMEKVPTHVDFYQISLGQKLSTMVAVTLTGESPGVLSGGIVQHGLREVEVECLPTDIPETIQADISGLDLGDKLTVGDLVPPPGVKLTSDPDALVVSIVAPRMAAEEPAAPVVEEGAEIPAEAPAVEERE